MARNFFQIFTENNPVMGYSKTFFIPEAKGLRKIIREQNSNVSCLILPFVMYPFYIKENIPKSENLQIIWKISLKKVQNIIV